MSEAILSDATWFLKLLSTGKPGPVPCVKVILISRQARALRVVRILGGVNSEKALRDRLKKGERFILMGTTCNQDLATMFCGMFLGAGCTKLVLFFGPPSSTGYLRQLVVQTKQFWRTRLKEHEKVR